MKANKILRQEAVDYIVNCIKHICGRFGPREPGSAGEREAQEYLARHITENQWADDVKFQEFEVAPKAFMGFSKIIPILVLLGAAGFWFVSWAPILFNAIGLIILFFQFLLYKKFLDPFYKKATSANLIATKKAEVETKRRIIVSGHVDAAYEWSVFRKFGMLVHAGGQGAAIVSVIAGIALSVIASINGGGHSELSSNLWMKILISASVATFIPLFFFSNYKLVVPGANDNLTGTLSSVAVLKYLTEAGVRYAHTDVVCVAMGSEEAGLRGAKAYAKEFAAELKDPNVETMFLGLETFRDLEHMAIYVRDLTGTVAHDKRCVAILDEAAKGFYDKPLPHSSVYVGASDAAAITQAGIPSVGLAAMDPAPARYYHTREDGPDNLDPKCIAMGLDLALAAVDIFDKKGLNG